MQPAKAIDPTNAAITTRAFLFTVSSSLAARGRRQIPRTQA
jgi:hypothetical protein